MNISDELAKLQELHQSGALTDDEFARAKERLLGGSTAFRERPEEFREAAPESLEQQTRQWAFFLHLSQLAGFVVPLAGLVAPILIWQLKKNDLPELDVHGKIVVNWIISEIIYFCVCIALAFVIIGIPLLIALGVCGIVFAIIGAIKANNGEVWKYPLSITFLK
jgi:uncharacterized Tic20 family protein